VEMGINPVKSEIGNKEVIKFIYNLKLDPFSPG
jgi:hypothetical protein